MKTDFYLHSVKGKRKRNDDFVGKSEFNAKRKKVVLLAAADGMGGYEGGNLASKKAVQFFLKTMKKHIQYSSSFHDIRRYIKKSYNQINREIYRDSRSDERLQDMGTTLTTLVLIDDQFVISNVGDSRAYILKSEDIQQITEDHSALAESLKEGFYSHREIKKMPYLNALTRNLGNDQDVEVDIFPTEGSYNVQNGSAVILLTDGITACMSELEIYDHIVSYKKLKDAAHNIVSRAYKKGSTDNMSIAILELGKLRRKDFKRFPKKSVSLKKRENISKKTILKSLILLSISVFLLFLMIIMIRSKVP